METRGLLIRLPVNHSTEREGQDADDVYAPARRRDMWEPASLARHGAGVTGGERPGSPRGWTERK